MAVGRVKHISPCLVGLPVGLTSKHRIAARLIRPYDARVVPLQTGEEPSLGVAMHIIETLVLDDAWQRTETFCPEGEMFHCGVVAR